MRLAFIVAISALTLVFVAVNGVLMCVSPRHFATFWAWYSRAGSQLSGDASGQEMSLARRIEFGAGGLTLVAMSVFLGWKLAEKVLGRPEPFDAHNRSIPAVTVDSSWLSVLVGLIAIIAGAYSLIRTDSATARLTSCLARGGLQYSLPTGVLQRRVKTLGVVFILAGAFCVVVAVRDL
jgi:hypothetical protein